MDEKKIVNILCYGDSNTYGHIPLLGMRYSRDKRWTGILQKILGIDYNVIEEGCNGRTTIYDDPEDNWRNGLDYLKPCLNSHKPVDIVIMMLGSNDLKKVFGLSAKEVANGAETLVKVIVEFTELKQGFVPKIILVSPPIIGDDIEKSEFGYAFDKTAITRSKEFSREYKGVSDRNGCIFFDAAASVESSKEDSLHLTEDSHAKFAEDLSKVILSL